MYLKNGIHPNLIVPQGYKECDYFNKLIERGVPLAKYLSEFPGFNNDLDSVHGRCGFNYDSEGSPYIRAEASPNYMPHPRAAIRARETLPDARIIVMLRGTFLMTLIQCIQLNTIRPYRSSCQCFQYEVARKCLS